jgi:hypothetical protein
MESHASPQDLLLAYNPGFTGFTSLSNMPQPIEVSDPDDDLLFGERVTPDGYYEDFTASLNRFVKNYPQIAFPQGGLKNGGASKALDWGVVVTVFDTADESEDGSDSASEVGHEDAEAGEGAEGEAGEGADEEADEDSEAGADEDSEADAGEDAKMDGDATGGAHHHLVASFGDFIIDSDFVGGAMDETDAEIPSYASVAQLKCAKPYSPKFTSSPATGFMKRARISEASQSGHNINNFVVNK